MNHHPIFEDFNRVSTAADSTFDINFVGSKVRHVFEVAIPQRGIFGSGRALTPDLRDASFPNPESEDYLEWVDLLESIRLADADFVMIEAGAGYGRWLVNGMNSIRRLKNSQIKSVKLVGIEPDPTRFGFLKQHFTDNEISLGEHELLQAGVSDTEGYLFQAQAANQVWAYGDPLLRSEHFDQLAKEQGPAVVLRKPDGSVGARPVPCIKLSGVVDQFPMVDLIDCDLQGEELRVIEEAIDSLDKKVRRLHIGTHAIEIEAGLRSLMASHGWKCVNDYGTNQQQQTPYGKVSFLDGIQTWVNPRL